MKALRTARSFATRNMPLAHASLLSETTNIAPFAITCGIYGWMAHTRFFGSKDEANAEYDKMNPRLLKSSGHSATPITTTGTAIVKAIEALRRNLSIIQ